MIHIKRLHVPSCIERCTVYCWMQDIVCDYLRNTGIFVFSCAPTYHIETVCQNKIALLHNVHVYSNHKTSTLFLQPEWNNCHTSIHRTACYSTHKVDSKRNLCLYTIFSMLRLLLVLRTLLGMCGLSLETMMTTIAKNTSTIRPILRCKEIENKKYSLHLSRCLFL